MNGFDLIDISSVVAFYPYDEQALAAKIDSAVDWELKYCRKLRNLARSEHLLMRVKEVKNDKEKKNISCTFNWIILIMAAIIGFVFSLISINRVGQMKAELSQMRRQYDEDLKAIEDDFEAKLASVERLLGSGGTLEQYIVAKNFLSNYAIDLETIITNEHKVRLIRPYFRIFDWNKRSLGQG